MQDPANELLRIPLPCTWVNKGPRYVGLVKPHLTAELRLPENYRLCSAARQPSFAQLFSACKRVARAVGGLLGS